MPNVITPVTAAARVLQPLLVVLRQRGQDSDAFLASLGLSADELNNPLTRVNEVRLRDAWQQALALTGDPALGLRVGRRTEPQAFGVLGYVLSNAPTVGRAFDLLERFNRLVFDEVLLYPERSSNGRHLLHLRRDAEADPEANRPLVEYFMTSLLRLAGFLVGGEDLGPRYLRALAFRHAQPQAGVLALYREYFAGAELQFDSHESRIEFESGFLDLPVAYADPQLLEVMQAQANQQLRALATEGDIVARCRACIRRRLLGRAPTVAAVAADCGMSRATLQRRLAAAGTSYQQQLDKVRLDFARELLTRSDTPLGEIAYLLGYAETAAFHHAFKRWTGTSPSRYREMQLATTD